MGNIFSKNNTNYVRLPESVWGYHGSESAIGGLYFSSLKDKDEKYRVLLFHKRRDDSRCTVYFIQLDFNPIGIEITITLDDTLTVYFMRDEDNRCNPVIWTQGDYELDSLRNLVWIKKKNEVVSDERRAMIVSSSNARSESNSLGVLPKRVHTSTENKNFSSNMLAFPNQGLFHDNCPSLRQLRETGSSMTTVCLQNVPHLVPSYQKNIDAILHQPFAQCGPASLNKEKEPERVTEFSGKDAKFHVSEDGKSIAFNKVGQKGTLSLGIVQNKIKEIKVYEISSGIFLILINDTDGLFYVSGYTNHRTAKSLNTVCVNPCFSLSSPKATFERIEFFPPKTADDGSDLRSRSFKLVFSGSISKTFNIDSNGVLNRIPNL